MSKKQPKKPQRTENQHYVSQFYLRGFTNASGRMFCYDKRADKSHPTTTAAAAQEPYFYEIVPGVLQDVTVPVNTMEKALAVYEQAWAPLHAELNRSADKGQIDSKLATEYAPFLVLQWMRTKTYRDTMREIMQESLQSLADSLMDVNFPGKKVKVTVGDKEMSAWHLKKIFDDKTVEGMSDCLRRHLWIVGINNSDHLSYTSDHPVVRRGNRTDNGRRLVGILDPGIEFAFPLDSRHVLLILERTHFADWQKYDCRAVFLSDDQVRDYNSLQVMRSSQRIYCAEDDFSAARQVCASHPDIRNPDRPRVRVGTTPIKNMRSFMYVIALE